LLNTTNKTQITDTLRSITTLRPAAGGQAGNRVGPGTTQPGCQSGDLDHAHHLGRVGLHAGGPRYLMMLRAKDGLTIGEGATSA
jgi:hypothetical protein